MADTAISALPNLAVADIASGDKLPIVDVSAALNKHILASALVQTAGAQSIAGLKTFTSGVQDGGGQVFNVKAFGALGDGSTNDTTAIQAAVTALKASVANKGGELFFPPGVYILAGQIDLDSVVGVTVRMATGPAAQDGSTRLIYTSSGTTPAITARGSNGLRIIGLRLFATSATFTGNLVDLSGPSFNTTEPLIDRCEFSGSLTCVPASLVFLKQCITAVIRHSRFAYAQVGILGRTLADPGSGTNIVKFEDVVFGPFTDVAAKNAGQSWTFDGCHFGPKINSTPCGYRDEDGINAYGLTFRNCWFGDASVDGTWITTRANGLTVDGCVMAYGGGASPLISIGSTTTAIYGVNIRGGRMFASNGVSITGNQNVYGVTLGPIDTQGLTTLFTDSSALVRGLLIEPSYAVLGQFDGVAAGRLHVPAYSTSITPNVTARSGCYITATDGVAFTIANPTGTPLEGQRYCFHLIAAAGAGMGTITWGGAWRLAGSFTSPAATKRRVISFVYDGAGWFQDKSDADI